MYRSLIGCVLAAVKRSCHEAGLHRAASVEISSLHGWLWLVFGFLGSLAGTRVRLRLGMD